MRRNLPIFDCYENIINDSFEMVKLLPKERAFVVRGHQMGRIYQKIAKDFQAIISSRHDQKNSDEHEGEEQDFA